MVKKNWSYKTQFKPFLLYFISFSIGVRVMSSIRDLDLMQ